MSVKKMTVLSLYTAVALILFVVESAIPMPVPLPFVKLGLANIITLIVLVCYSPKDAFLVLMLLVVKGVGGRSRVSFQAQQHIEQLEATNTRLNAAIQAVGSAKAELADVINLRNDFIKHRDNYKARYMQAKTDYGKICDSLRQAECLVAKAQSNLDSRIDQLSIVAFGLPGFDEIMNAVIGTLPAKKEE